MDPSDSHALPPPSSSHKRSSKGVPSTHPAELHESDGSDEDAGPTEGLRDDRRQRLTQPLRNQPLQKESVPFDKARLWQLQPARDLGFLLLILVVLAVALALSPVTVPAFLAFLLAYTFDPVVKMAQKKWNWPRAATTSLCLLVLLACGAGLAAYLIPQVISDGKTVMKALPRTSDHLAGWLNDRGFDAAAKELKATLEGAQLKNPEKWIEHAGGAAKFVSGVAGGILYLILAGSFFLGTFCYFSIRMPHLPKLASFFPGELSPRIDRVLSRCGAAFGAYIRGQFVVALFTTTMYAVGFSLLGVPQALLAAAIGGTLSFIPNGQVAGLVAAWIFGTLDAEGVSDPLATYLYPAGVFFVSQSLETFVVTPWVQGAQTKLHPLMVFGALLAGAYSGGLLGVFLAIPLAASVRIVWEELRRERLVVRSGDSRV